MLDRRSLAVHTMNFDRRVRVAGLFLLLLVCVPRAFGQQELVVDSIGQSSERVGRLRGTLLGVDSAAMARIAIGDFNIFDLGIKTPAKEGTFAPMGGRRIPDWVFVFDAPSRIDNAQRVAARIVQRSTWGSERFGIVTIDRTVGIVQSLTSDHDLAARAIDRVSCSAGATIVEGLIDSLGGAVALLQERMLDSLPDRKTQVVIITDGSSFRLPADLGAVSNAFGNRMCGMHVCFLGDPDRLDIVNALRASEIEVESIEIEDGALGPERAADRLVRTVWDRDLTPIELTWNLPDDCTRERTTIVSCEHPTVFASGVLYYSPSAQLRATSYLSGSTFAVEDNTGGRIIWYEMSFSNGYAPTVISGFATDDPDVVVAPTFSLPYPVEARKSVTVMVGYVGTARGARTIRIHPISTACSVVDAQLKVGGYSGATGESVVLKMPEPGKTLRIGDTVTIAWGSSRYHPVAMVDYSTNGGSAWTEISPLTYDSVVRWTVPPPETDSALVRVTGLAGPTVTTTLSYPSDTLLTSAASVGGGHLYYASGSWVRRCEYYDGAHVLWEYRIPCGGLFATGARTGNVIAADVGVRTVHTVNTNGARIGLDLMPIVPHALTLLEDDTTATVVCANSEGKLIVKRIGGPQLYGTSMDGDVSQLIASRRGGWFAAGLRNVGVRVYGLADSIPIATILPPRLGMSPQLGLANDDLLAVGWTGDSGVVLYSTTSWYPIDTLLRDVPTPRSFSVSADGKVIYYMREGVGIVGVDIRSNEPVSIVPLASTVDAWVEGLADTVVALFNGKQMRTYGVAPELKVVSISDSLFSIGYLHIDARNLVANVGKVRVGEVHDTVFAKVLCNTGRIAADIDSIVVYTDGNADCAVSFADGDRTLEPGVCLALRLRVRVYTPGSHESFVLLRTKEGDYSVRVLLEAISGPVSWTVQNVDMGSRPVGTRRDTLVRMALVNQTDDSLTVGLRVKRAAEFRLLSDSMLTLGPHADGDIALEFAPSAVGTVSDALVAFVGTDTASLVSLSGRGTGSRLSISTSSINIGGTCSIPDTALVRLRNDGNANLLIQRVELSDNDAKRFSISSTSGLYGRVLGPGDEVAVAVTLDSPVDSTASAALEVHTETANVPSGVRRVPIYAVSSLPSIVVSPPVVPFPNATVGDTASATAWLKNVGVVPFMVRTPAASGDWRLVSVDPPITAPGDSSAARFEYYARTSPGDYSQHLDLVAEPCGKAFAVDLSARVAPPTTGSVRVPYTEARSPGTVTIPIILDHADRFASGDSTLVIGTLRLSADRFVPVGNTIAGTVENGTRVIRMEFPVRQRRGDTLGTLSFLVHSGEYFLAEPLILDSFRTSDGSFSLSTKNGWVLISSAGPWMTIRAADDSVVSGDEVVIRLLLADSSSSGVVRSGYLEGELLIAERLLDPAGATPQGSVNNGTRRIHVARSLSEVEGLTLVALPFRAWSAVDTSVTIQLVNFKRNSGASSVSTINGQLVIRGVAVGPPEDSTGRAVVYAFPNPAAEILHIRFRLFTDEGMVRLTNTMGEAQAGGERRLEQRGVHEFDMDLRGFPAGLYFLRLEDGANRYVIGVRVEH